MNSLQIALLILVVLLALVFVVAATILDRRRNLTSKGETACETSCCASDAAIARGDVCCKETQPTHKGNG